MSESFFIQSQTKSLAQLLEEPIEYHIPIYQREYSWEESQVNRLIGDVLYHFDSNESLFLGTLQITGIKSGNPVDYREIIDGQQRFITLGLLVLALSQGVPSRDGMLILSRMKTNVSHGEAQKRFSAFCSAYPNNSDDSRYANNIRLLTSAVENVADKCADREKLFAYLMDHLLFVVIETQASLSKTLQIFNSINTAGMDLGISDTFKIRLFDYMHHKKHVEEKEAFSQIDRLYGEIEERNHRMQRELCTVPQLMRTYQFLLVGRHALRMDLMQLSVESFYDCLFDTILGIRTQEGFSGAIEIHMRELWRLMELRYAQHAYQHSSLASYLAVDLICYSRYSKYWMIPDLFRFLSSIPLDEPSPEYEHFQVQLAKLFMIFSIRFKKSVYEMHRFVWEAILPMMMRGDAFNAQLLLSIEQKTQNVWDWNGQIYSNRGEIQAILADDITENARCKNLICLLSALLEEEAVHPPPKDYPEIAARLLGEFDVEHIQPVTPEDADSQQIQYLQWGPELHKLGNLVLLERNLNRSIQNIHTKKQSAYEKSTYQGVQCLVSQIANWSVKDATSRRGRLSHAILTFLFGEKLDVYVGNIFDVPGDIIVNPANRTLGRGSGLCGQIHARAGEALTAECVAHGAIAYGEVFVTQGYQLTYPYILHAAVPKWYEYNNPDKVAQLRNCYCNCMQEAARLQGRIIVFPCLGMGHYKWPYEEAIGIAVEEVFRQCVLYPTISKILFCCSDEEKAAIYRRIILRKQQINER